MFGLTVLLRAAVRPEISHVDRSRGRSVCIDPRMSVEVTTRPYETVAAKDPGVRAHVLLPDEGRNRGPESRDEQPMWCPMVTVYANDAEGNPRFVVRHTPRAALPNLVYWPRNTSFATPVGPERCLAMISSADALSGESRLYTSSR